MKNTIFALIALTCVAYNSQAQGSVVFASSSNPNTTQDVIFNSNTGQNEVAGTGLMIALYAALPTEMNRDNITTQIGATTSIIMGSPGEFSGGIIAVNLGGGLPNTMNPQAAFVVRAWDGAFGSDWATFVANAPATATRGESGVFVQNAGVFGGPFVLPEPLTGFTGVVLVPEPSTYALGAMGLGALAFLRRRKA
jgi:hypothetical protein